jgi:hypothetical protein
MKMRSTTLALAAGATLALVTPAAEAQILKGGRSLPVAGSAKKGAAHVSTQYLVRFYMAHGPAVVHPGGLGLTADSNPTRPDDRAGARGA